MSTQYPGGFITKTPVAPTSSVASGIWTLDQALQNKQAGTWPSPVTVPGAPTIGTATGGNAQASVTFTAPASDGGSPITGYRITSTPGSITATGASSPIVITGLTNGTSYTFTAAAQNAIGYGAESAASNSVTPAAPTGWTRILNIGGDSSTSGTVSVSGYSEILVFGVAPGGSGGKCGDDDGGGGGGGGAAQLSGYKLSVPGGVTTLYYSTPNPSANPAIAEPGVYQSNLEVRSTNSGGTLLLSLNAGQNGGGHNLNSSTVGSGGAGGTTGTYGSAAGTVGGIGSIRNSPTTARTAGTNNAGASGAGGGGAWLGTNTGAAGGSSSSLSVTVSTYDGGSLDTALTAAGVAGGAGGAGNPSPTSGGTVNTAGGGTFGDVYCGGGGAGGGIRFFGTGNYYGAGGGGGGGQGGTGGKGGAAYLVIYAR